MKNIYKAAIVTIALVMTAVTAQAQEKGDMAAVAKFAFGTGDRWSNFGIGAEFQYNVMDPLRLEAGFTYFIPKDKLSMWDLSVNANWLFRVGGGVNVYPLAGIGILGSRVSVLGVSVGASDFAFNIGGGADFFVSQSMFINAEAKYMIASGGRLILSAGVGFMF